MVEGKLYSKYYDMTGIEVKDRYSVGMCYDLSYWHNTPDKQVDLTLRYSKDRKAKHLCCVSITKRDIEIDITTEDGIWKRFIVVDSITELYIRVKNVLKSLPELVRDEYIKVLDMYIEEWSEGK